MPTDILLAVIGAAETLVVAIIAGLFARNTKRQQRLAISMEERSILRAEESKQSMKMMSASIGLGIATATAIKEGKTNGIMDSALKKAYTADKDYDTFIEKMASRHLATNT